MSNWPSSMNILTVIFLFSCCCCCNNKLLIFAEEAPKSLSLLPFKPDLKQPPTFALQQPTKPTTTTSTTNTNNINYRSDTNSENISIGNTNTKNYNFQQSSYLPTQLTQVVLNVPKPKKTRISRPPTEEEFAIKRKILNVFETTKKELSQFLLLNGQQQSINFDHLGRILQALNPKYIATERVRRVTFGDPQDPTTLFPLPDVQPQPLSTLSLKTVDGGDQNINTREQLDMLINFFKTHVTWELPLANNLANTNENQLSPEQIAFKRLLLCLTRSAFCPKPETNNFVVNQQNSRSYEETNHLANNDQQIQQLADEMEEPEAVGATSNNLVYAPPPQQQVQFEAPSRFQMQQQPQYVSQQQMYLPIQQQSRLTNNISSFIPQSNLDQIQSSPVARQAVAQQPISNRQVSARYQTRYQPPKWIIQEPQFNNNYNQQQRHQQQQQQPVQAFPDSPFQRRGYP